MHNKCMSLYGNSTTYRISVVLWVPFALKTLLGESSPAQAKHVRRKVEVAGKTLRIRRSRKQRVIIAYKIISGVQSQTSIRISRGTGSFRVASQGLSRQFLKAQFRRRFS